jgi:hypothetical protein
LASRETTEQLHDDHHRVIVDNLIIVIIIIILIAMDSPSPNDYFLQTRDNQPSVCMDGWLWVHGDEKRSLYYIIITNVSFRSV